MMCRWISTEPGTEKRLVGLSWDERYMWILVCSTKNSVILFIHSSYLDFSECLLEEAEHLHSEMIAGHRDAFEPSSFIHFVLLSKQKRVGVSGEIQT